MYFPKIFQKIFDFGYQRRGLEIPAFYITFLIGSVICGALVGSVIAAFFGGDQTRIDWKVDVITASIVVLLITHVIIMKKKLGGNMLYRALPLIAAVVSQFATPAFALIIPTWLTMKPINNMTDTKMPISGNDGANEQVIKQQQQEDIPPPTGLGDTIRKN